MNCKHDSGLPRCISCEAEDNDRDLALLQQLRASPIHETMCRSLAETTSIEPLYDEGREWAERVLKLLRGSEEP